MTTHVIGQDGVAFAPASPDTMAYMRRYTAGFNGNFPTPGRSWHTVTKFLSQFDGQCAINACVLIPNGNVRMEVMGLDPRKPHPGEIAKMKALVREGMEQGAVGVSSGLDYVPSIYADEDELTSLCEEIAPYGGIYVTHMRGYNREKAPAALQEVFDIGRRANCGVHVSHFNCLADQTIPLLDAARADGVDVTFDLYCYLYGSTIVAMLTLPPEMLAGRDRSDGRAAETARRRGSNWKRRSQTRDSRSKRSGSRVCRTTRTGISKGKRSQTPRRSATNRYWTSPATYSSRPTSRPGA